MFSRRKRSLSHHQPLSSPAAQSAQSAASHAFLKSQPSSSSLSSAAAAAALRSRTPTPTLVENVQTKRMVQRRGSIQSQASPLTTRRSASVSGTLRRSNSSSSMTARTFRESSPHRPSTSSGPVDVPPLPNLPAQYTSRKIPGRAASLGPSMRSPPAPPPHSAARGTSVDRQREGPPVAHSPSHIRVGSLNTVPEIDRPGSRNSVNFSYPRGARPNSPTLVVENRPISLGSAIHEEPPQKVGETQLPISEKPVNAKPKALPAGNAEGSNAGKSAEAAVGTAVAAAQAVSVQKSGSPEDSAHARAEQRDDANSTTTIPQDYHFGHALPITVSNPENEHPSSRAVPDRWPATVPEENEPNEDTSIVTSQVQEPENRLGSASPTADHVQAAVTPESSPSSAREPWQQQEIHLRQSSSPGRSARFSKWLSVTTADGQVHQPPPRSVSPVKSALKHPRGNSLSPDRKVGVAGHGGQPPSEISDGTSIASDEGSRMGAKKRSVKVSFDDEAEIVGIAASPPTSPEDYILEVSPPIKSKSRMSWLGVGKKKPTTSEHVTGDDGFDEVLKPRPVLPSFGSVRGNRESGLPGPAIPEFSDNESSSSSNDDDEGTAPGLSFSHDHAIGRMLPKLQSKEPRQVHDLQTVEQLSINGDLPSSKQRSPDLKTNGVAVGGIIDQPPFAGVNSEVPAIAVEPATPPVESDRRSFDHQRSSLEQYRIPGGFPASNSDRNLKKAAKSTKTQPVANTVPKLDDVDTEGESGDSVYSDAAEEFDGDGFGSINAIVDSRSIYGSSVPVEKFSESRDTTPRPLGRATAVGAQSKAVTDEAPEEGRSVTPTQNSVNRQAEEPSAPARDPIGFGGPCPPLPIKSKARGPLKQNGTTRLEPSKQTRPMSVDARRVSAPLQDTRSSTASEAGKSKPRPLSLGPAFQRMGSQGGAPAFPSSLRRTMSSGSDSSSSFKRASVFNRGDVPHSMRRTMRSSPTFAPAQSPSSRSESPNEYRPMSSGSSTGAMRKTLRGPGTGGERYSFFSTNKKAPRSRFVKPPPKSGQSSRFSDSEEDETRPQAFRSRFADSSDEDEPGSNAMRPVRGIPRRQGAHDGDSTELEDSSEEDRQQQRQAVAALQLDPTPPGSRDTNAPPNMSGMAAVARQRGMSQRELEEWLMQPPRGRKPSILARLGLKKSKNSDHRIRKADVESPSRRDTPLERSRLERDQLREPGFVNSAQGTTVTTVTATRSEPSSSPKLQKKNTKRFTVEGGESWPLRVDPRTETPEPVVEQSHSLPSSPLRTEKSVAPIDTSGRNGGIVVHGDGETPAESAGRETQSAQRAQRARAGPDLNDDDLGITTSEEPGPTARNVVISGSGRRKRFPMLRKAFGLRA